MKHRREIVPLLIAVLVLMLSSFAAFAQSPPDGTGAPQGPALPGFLAGYFAQLGVLSVAVWALVELIGRFVTWPREKVAPLLGVALAVAAHLYGVIPAPGGKWDGVLWAVVCGAAVIGGGSRLFANAVANPLTPKDVDLAYRTPAKNGTS